MRKGFATQVLVVLVTATAFSCTDRADTPSARPDPGAGAAAGSAAEGSTSSGPVATRITLGTIAGRLDDAKRERVKGEVQALVDAYLDAAFVAGPYPREDFLPAFASFRGSAAASAAADVDLLTNHDLAAQLSAVVATKRRVRLDVLAPDDRAKGVTARFVLDLGLTGDGVPATRRITGSLYLSHQKGAWSVFGYDVSKGTA